MKKNTIKNSFFSALALGLLAAAPVPAQTQGGSSLEMPGMTMPAAAPHMRGMDMTDMSGMSSSVDLNDPMSQEASGTAWLPSSSPMYGKMSMNKYLNLNKLN